MNIQSKTKARTFGLTLTELLVSISILLLLCSLVMVGVYNSRRRANATVCLSNVRQQAMRLCEFSQEWGSYPLSMNLTERDRYPEHKGAWWLTLFDKGAPGTGVFRCPSAFRPDSDPYKRRENIYHHYGYNHGGILGFPAELSLGLGGLTVRHDLGPPVKEAEVLAPSEMIAIGDGFASWAGKVDDGVAFIGRMFSVTGMAAARTRAEKRHTGNVITGFADGHVESVPFSLLFDEESPRILRRWNRDNQDHSERMK